MIRIGPLMIPCRKCHAAPGEPCRQKDRGPIPLQDRQRNTPHRLRERDADMTSDLLDL